jgi:hypothetical protein
MPPMRASDLEAAEAATRGWVREAAIGLGLCPFAAEPFAGGRVRIHASSARTVDAAVRVTLGEAVRLLDTPAETLETSLVVFPRGLRRFSTYLEALSRLEGALSAGGADGVLQVASFHPRYVFEGPEPDDPAHDTNRTPHPCFHLLRERSMTAALEAYPDPEQIPVRNVARLRALPPEARARLRAGRPPFDAPSVDGLPDVRDGLSHLERLVLTELALAQAERGGGAVPSAELYGRLVERISIRPAELQAILQRLGAGST